MQEGWRKLHFYLRNLWLGFPWLGKVLQEAILVVKWTSARAKRARGPLVTADFQVSVHHTRGLWLPTIPSLQNVN